MDGSGFRPITTRRASSVIADQIQALLAAGKISAGDRLPPERSLVKILKVGRSTLREAIRHLESLGVVETRRGAGTFMSADELPLVILPRGSGTVSAQQAILETRLVMEPEIAALAAIRATVIDLDSLRSILSRQAAHVAAGEPATSADIEFHATICRISRNPILERLCRSLKEAVQQSRHVTDAITGWPAKSLRQHHAILTCIEARNPSLARVRMRQHLRHVQRMHVRVPDAAVTRPG